MVLSPMHPAANSIETQLAGDISAIEQIIPVADISAFPPGPNFATIGRDNDAEVILYQAIGAGTLTGCLRGRSGTSPQVWGVGSFIYHSWTSDSANAITDNINALATEVESKTTPQQLTDAITAHDASGTSHADMRADIAGKATPADITAAVTAHDAGTAHTAQFATKVDKTGGTLTGPLIAGGTQTEATAQTRNAVILPAGTTDFSGVSNSTLIFVKEA